MMRTLQVISSAQDPKESKHNCSKVFVHEVKRYFLVNLSCTIYKFSIDRIVIFMYLKIRFSNTAQIKPILKTIYKISCETRIVAF